MHKSIVTHLQSTPTSLQVIFCQLYLVDCISVSWAAISFERYMFDFVLCYYYKIRKMNGTYRQHSPRIWTTSIVYTDDLKASPGHCRILLLAWWFFLWNPLYLFCCDKPVSTKQILLYARFHGVLSNFPPFRSSETGCQTVLICGLSSILVFFTTCPVTWPQVYLRE